MYYINAEQMQLLANFDLHHPRAPGRWCWVRLCAGGVGVELYQTATDPIGRVSILILKYS